MTEQTYAEPLAAEDPYADDAVADRNRRVIIIVGGVVAALVLLGGGYLLLSGGSSTPVAAPVAHHVVRPVVPGATAALPASSPPRIPGTFTGTLGRDPFKPLYVVPVAVVAPVGGVTGTKTGPAAGTGTTTTPGGNTAPGGTAGTPGMAPSGSTATPAKTYPLQLVRVDRSGSQLTAVFMLSGKSVTAQLASGSTPATIFGPNKELQLVGLTEEDAGRWSATIAVGESRTDVQQGTTIYVA